jgi:arginyl-tRNA synthetase
MGLNTDITIDNRLSLTEKEKSVLKILHSYPEIVIDAATTHNPSLVANFSFDLAKEFNQFYHDHIILKEEDQQRREFRLLLTIVCGNVIKSAMSLLGIEVPERM